jgi:spore coat polysaccharide biosynthesis protein SpsF
MNIILIIQARMNSSRLPEKVLKLIEDKTVLQHVIDRCTKSKYINKIIVATTTNSLDDILENYCVENNINYYRGSEDNVLERFYMSVQNENPDLIIRVTSDCPLIDSNIIDDMIKFFIQKNLIFLQPKYTCGDNQKQMGGFPDGCNPQIFTYEILKTTKCYAKLEHDKEHVCPYMVRNYMTEEYIMQNIENYKNIDFTKLHLSLDTESDFDYISKIYKHLYKNNPDFTIYDVLNLINNQFK